MRQQLGAFLDELAFDDDIKVVLLRGEGGVFSTGADMDNAYAWYGDGADEPGTASAGPSQRRRLLVDRQTFDFYHVLPRATRRSPSPRSRASRSGGGFELALMADIAVVARDTLIGMPATRFLGPALGSLHMFFHRLGPVLARRLLLTGDTIEAGEVGAPRRVHRGRRPRRRRRRGPAWWAEKASRMPADGIVMAKEAFRLVEQLQALPGRGGAQLPVPRLRHQPPVRRGRVQLRQGPGRARHQAGLRAPRRPLRGPRASGPGRSSGSACAAVASTAVRATSCAHR